MLTLEVISTGSSGNFYKLVNNKTKKCLLLECGLKYNDVLLYIEDIRNIEVCLLSHQHFDHNAKNGKHTTSELLQKAQIDILSFENAKPLKVYKFGEFEVIPLEHKHNVPCFGYLIRVGEEVIYFATDTSSLIDVQGVNINHFIVECNYIDSLLDIEILKDSTNLLHLNSIRKNHCSLERLENYFKRLDYKPKNIITIHASNSGYIDKKQVVEKLSKFADNVYVAINKTNYEL